MQLLHRGHKHGDLGVLDAVVRESFGLGPDDLFRKRFGLELRGDAFAFHGAGGRPSDPIFPNDVDLCYGLIMKVRSELRFDSVCVLLDGTDTVRIIFPKTTANPPKMLNTRLGKEGASSLIAKLARPGTPPLVEYHGAFLVSL